MPIAGVLLVELVRELQLLQRCVDHGILSRVVVVVVVVLDDRVLGRTEHAAPSHELAAACDFACLALSSCSSSNTTFGDAG